MLDAELASRMILSNALILFCSVVVVNEFLNKDRVDG
jgi:hypothetical protein